MLIAINYHYIRENYNEPYPSIFGVKPQQFSDRLDQIGQYADFLSIDDLVEIIEGRKRKPKNSVVITFDDGFREQYELAWPILKKKGIPAIFFINTSPIKNCTVTTTHKIHIIRAFTPPDQFKRVLEKNLIKNNIDISYPAAEVAKNAYKYDNTKVARLKFFLNHTLGFSEQYEVINDTFLDLGFNEDKVSKELYMTKGMINELSQNSVVGTHGHTHRPLGLLNDEDAVIDFEKSVRLLEGWTNTKIKALSYPFGYKEACSQAVATAASKNDVKFAFTMERAGNQNLSNPLFLARFSNSDLPNDYSNKSLKKFWKNIPVAQWNH